MLRVDADASEERLDDVAHEEPLELQVDGHAFAVVMRTPGHDEELGTGFALTEGLVHTVSEIVSVRHCTVVPTEDAEDNILQLRLRTPIDLARFRRNLFASSSCGVCGKATLENALKSAARVESSLAIDRQILSVLPARLRAEQAAFERTGGLHAAALFDTDGRLHVVREDVGRHNAVDKVIGWALRNEKPLRDLVLVVSGRLSFELVQKSVAAGIPLLAGISAPTSLAIRMAETLGVTLVGFLRGSSMNVYAHSQRVL